MYVRCSAAAGEQQAVAAPLVRPREAYDNMYSWPDSLGTTYRDVDPEVNEGVA